MYCVIMAGGSGTRFWPYSRQERPKQLLKIIGGKSMLQMTVDRLSKLKFVQGVFIITREDLAEVIRQEITGLEPDAILVEPSAKNTGPCIGLAALRIKQIDENAVMGVFPADHLIVGHQKFAKALRTANHLCRKNTNVVTIGVKPDHPATGYGYIQYDPVSDEDHLEAYEVKTFAEKPHKTVAERFIESGDFLWNSGIFVWKISTLMARFDQHMPDLFHQLEIIRKKIESNKPISDTWKQIQPVSIDYGLMEKMKENLFVIRATFEWSDLGSWDAVKDLMAPEKTSNVIRGEGVILDGENNFIQSEDHFTGVYGLNNVVVVHTDDATLVIDKNKVENVKEIVEWLKKEKKDKLL